MKNIYYVIDKLGVVHKPEQYLVNKSCSENMNICIRREVLNEDIAPKRVSDYVKNANILGFSWEKNSSIGFINYDYKANLIMKLVQEYARYLVEKIGMPIYEVKGSNFFNLNYPVVQDYASLFGDRLFNFKDKDDSLVMSYDCSYPQFNIASESRVRESKLPYAHFSISDCFRYEQSGECMLLYRNRRFHMPDIHPYFKDVDQAWQWYEKIEDSIKDGFSLANKEYINVAKVSSNENWEKYKDEIVKIAIRNKKEILVDIKNDNQNRYWIVDIDYSFIDSFNQVREIGCIQIDIGNAKRLGIEYINDKGEKKDSVIIHCAIPGGIERYIYMLIDNMSEFPIEFKPIQLRLIPVSDKYISKCVEILNKYPNLRIDIDDRSLGVSKKVKDAHKEYIPHSIVIGEKEINDESLVHEKINSLISNLKIQFPYIRNNWNVMLDSRVE